MNPRQTKNKMETTKLTSKEVRDVAPTECDNLESDGELILGGLQMPIPEIDSWPSGYDLDQEAKAKFGAARIADCEPSDDDETVTWIVIRA